MNGTTLARARPAPRPEPPARADRLRRRLDALARTYDRRFLASDPVEFAHRFADPVDAEAAGLVAASLAYGRADVARRSAAAVLETLGARPARAAREVPERRLVRRLAGFRHRFTTGRDVAALVALVGRALERWGSLGAVVREGCAGGDGGLGAGLARLSDALLSLPCAVYGGRRVPARAGVRYLLPSPARGSACKRLCMWARWMARPADGVDLGLWTFLPPSRLVVPLDTHVARLARYLGFTARRAADWRTALEVTESLRALDPDDPTRYDFALSRLGILDRCPSRRVEALCRACPIRDVCAIWADSPNGARVRAAGAPVTSRSRTPSGWPRTTPSPASSIGTSGR